MFTCSAVIKKVAKLCDPQKPNNFLFLHFLMARLLISRKTSLHLVVIICLRI
jgi:hypothetical protein